MILIENEMKTHLFLKTFNVVNEINISLAYAAFTLLYRITTALLKINTKLPFHSVYGYYRLYES